MKIILFVTHNAVSAAQNFGNFLQCLFHFVRRNRFKNYLIELVGINIGMLKVPYFIFTEGMVIGGMIDDNGEILDYVITVDSLGSEEATLTFKKIK